MEHDISTPAPKAHGGPLAGRAAVVTGGSRGIGRAIVRRLTSDGATVVFTYRLSPGEAVYVASKAALEQFTRVASRELGPRGITVNTVSPGPTDTLLRRASTVEALQGIATMTPLGRLRRPADVADLVGLLVRPDSRWVTGQNIRRRWRPHLTAQVGW